MTAVDTPLVSFHAFRPGTGKTTILTNTAVCAAYQGWRVGIIDADLQSPAAHLFLNQTPGQANFSQYLWGNCTITEASRTVPLADASGKLFLLPASDHPHDLLRAERVAYHEAFLPTAVEEFAACHQLDLILIDLHAGLSTAMLTAMSISNLFLLTLRLDEQDYQGSSIITSLANKLDTNLGLVVNSIPARYQPQQVKTAVSEAYQQAVWAVVPYSPDIAVLSSRDVLACHTPHHPLVQLYEALSLDVMDRVRP